MSPTDGGIDNKSQDDFTEQSQEENPDDYEDDQSEGSEGSEYEEATNDDNEEHEWENPCNQGKKIPGGVHVLPPLLLTDQIHLLTAGSPTWQTAGSEDGTELDDQTEITSLSQADTSEEKLELETDTQNEQRKRNVSDPGPVVPGTLESRRGSTSSDLGSESSKEKKSLLITSSQPPWIEMVEVMGGCAWDNAKTIKCWCSNLRGQISQS